jgi:hypothetical protein
MCFGSWATYALYIVSVCSCIIGRSAVCGCFGQYWVHCTQQGFTRFELAWRLLISVAFAMPIDENIAHGCTSHSKQDLIDIIDIYLAVGD